MNHSPRFRRCPVCKTIAEASAFAYVGQRGFGSNARRCPSCGYVSDTLDFMRVLTPTAPMRAAVLAKAKAGAVAS